MRGERSPRERQREVCAPLSASSRVQDLCKATDETTGVPHFQENRVLRGMRFLISKVFA